LPGSGTLDGAESARTTSEDQSAGQQSLARKLRGADAHSIHIPSPTYRELRHLVQLRDTHMHQVAATKCRIKALLTYQGIEFPSASGTGS
jgi:hypothetical protein